ncbi:protein GET4-like isoform X4 [Aristolochia californica]|uniref:protein GET4-like isoform X4 n=1 Tax=Aristolochia californica TaxID=171875 RepID=UPI0035D998D9
MVRERVRRGVLAPAQETIEKLEKVVKDGNSYEAQQMYKSTAARFVSAQRFAEALDIFQSGASLQLKQGQVTCGAELAVLFVDTLVKGKFGCNEDMLDRIKKIYKEFPQVSLPQQVGVDEDMQKLSEALGAAKIRVEGCSSFLKAALRWSAEFGAPQTGSPELHDMLAEYIYSESPEMDMAKVSLHFVRGNHPEKFASTLVNFMGKCYPGEDDLAIARAVLMLERDALPLLRILRQNFKSSIEREPAFNELLDEIAERFYGVRRTSGLGMFGDLFKVMGGEGMA